MSRPHRANDPAANKAAIEKADLARKQELEDIKTMLSTAAGMRFFVRLFTDGHMFATTFTGNSWSYFKEGERNLALRYFNDVRQAAPDLMAKILIRKDDDNE